MNGRFMKIEVLENSRIKVTLTAEDLIYYNLKPEKLSPRSPGLHKFLFYIMENVRRETGFNPYKGAVAVEAMQSRDGVVLYISGFKKEEENTQRVSIRGAEKRVRIKTKKLVSPENFYSFDDFSALCKALIKIEENALRKSKLYQYENKWYFILGPGENFEKSHCILSEYCTDFGGMMFSEGFLTEHGKAVAAGESLVSLAEGIKKLEE